MKTDLYNAIIPALATADVRGLNECACLEIALTVRGSEVWIFLCKEDLERIVSGKDDVQIDCAYDEAGLVWPLASNPGECDCSSQDGARILKGEAFLTFPAPLLLELRTFANAWLADMEPRANFELVPYRD